MSGVPPPTGTERVLVVCTANQCRSALAGVMLDAQLRRLDRDVAVDSAGMQAEVGMPATEPTVSAAAAMGLDLSAHRSRPTTPALISAADLIIAMERNHVRDVVLTDPQAFSRTFTLKELLRRGTEVGPRQPGESLAQWVERAHEGRRPVDLLGLSADDDIVDPTGDRLFDHRSTAREIDEFLAELIDLVWPEPG